MQEMNSSYPAEFSFNAPEKVANWRPLVNWLLSIPHLVILYGLRILAEVVAYHFLVCDPLHRRAPGELRQHPSDVHAI